MNKRIFLSPPYFGQSERNAVKAAFDSGYVAPCGPQVDEFERRLALLAHRKFATAVSSGTAAIDLIMDYYGVDSSWLVIAPTLTFIATVGPAYHRGAKLLFVDSDPTGNVDIKLLEQALTLNSKLKTRKLVLSVDLYGRPCPYKEIAAICRRHKAIYISDSAEAVGAKDAGRYGDAAVFSFNGNKIITTSGGGAVLTDNSKLAAHVRKASQQSREPRLWYEHKSVGYNYRLSNLLGSLGLAQLDRLPEILAKRAANKLHYAKSLSILPSVEGENNWLTVALFPNKKAANCIIEALAAANIESRPVWKPMHLQPVFKGVKCVGGKVAEDLFNRGVCLPSGSGLTSKDRKRIDEILKI